MVSAITAHNVRSRRSPLDFCNPWHSPCNLSMAISSQQVAIVFLAHMPDTLRPWMQAFIILWCFFMCFMISLIFLQGDSSYTLVMFCICAFMFSLILLTNGQHWQFSILWRFLVYSVSCQKTILAAGRHPEQTMWAKKAPTRRPKRFYKEIVTSFELLPKVDGPELQSVNPISFFMIFRFQVYLTFEDQKERSRVEGKATVQEEGQKEGMRIFQARVCHLWSTPSSYRPEIRDDWH